jgi:Holliday junction DNA helicase RuvA
MLASENSVRLFGFADAEDAAAYELLLTVSGVGPKAAMAILDALPAPRLKAAIASGDDKLVASARGVGAKTAQVLILKLRDKMGELPALPDAPPGERSPRGEAAEALLSLGYTKAQAAQAVAAVAADGKNSEEIIRAALKKLSK